MQNEKNILKWLDRALTEAELKDLKETEDFKALEPIIKRAEDLRRPEFKVTQSLEELKSRKAQRRKLKWNQWMRVAAIGLLCIMAGGIITLFVNGSTQFSTGVAEQSATTLPDGSEVLLNVQSEITYKENNWDKNRSIELKGEAFFKVAKGKTFTVHTPDGEVQVLGTQFNVRYRKDLFEVSCFEGSVSVSLAGETKVLKPGESVTVIQGVLQPSKATKNSQPAWLQNKTTYEATPLYIVFAELERIYDITIKTEDKSILEKKFSGSFVNNNLSMAMEVIGYSTDMNYQIKENKVVVLYGK